MKIKSLMKMGLKRMQELLDNGTLDVTKTIKEFDSYGESYTPLKIIIDEIEDTEDSTLISKTVLKKVELLLKSGADPNELYQDNWTVFADTLMIGNIDLIKLFLKYGADPNKDNAFSTHILYHPKTEIIKLLIKHGLKKDLNYFNENKPIVTKLAEDRNYLILFVLLEAGWNPDGGGKYKETPMTVLTSRLVQNKGSVNDATRQIIYSMGGLASYGAKTDIVVDSFYTPLTTLCEMNENEGMFVPELIDSIRLFIQSGADLNIEKIKGVTPLRTAIQAHNSIITKLLIEAGADIDTLDGDGDSVLTLAIRSFMPDVAELLFKKGCEFTDKDIEVVSDRASESSSDPKWAEILKGMLLEF